ncbi:MAG: carboxymuconolactone decarboxylase family protein, partial [Dehalococcoidales bacterium]
RILMALAMAASHGAFESVALLAEAAAKAGASTEEITEALGLRQFTGGVSSLYTSAKALGELQGQRRRHDSAS